MPKNILNFHAEQTSLFKKNNAVADYVQRWGHWASIALLDPACHIFHSPNIDGIIGYRLEAGCAIVFGDPVCQQADMPRLITAFHEYHAQTTKNIIHISASENFVEWGLKEAYRIAIAIGKEVILNPSLDPKSHKGADGSNLRNKYNQAARLNLVVKEHCGINIELEQEIEAVGKSWLQNRSGPQIYLLQVDLFSDRTNKRWFYATHGNRVVGVLMINRLDTYQGWCLNMVMILPDAPNITSEILVLSMLDVLRQEECTFVSVGTIATTSLERVIGLSTITSWLAYYGFKLATKILKLNSRQQYWKKFHPKTALSYLLFHKPRIGIKEIAGIMRALNVGR